MTTASPPSLICDNILIDIMNIKSHIKRLEGLPTATRRELAAARRNHGWTQAELGHRVGLPQMHISGIETGKIVPRFNTLLDLVRVLDYDFLLIPRSLVPAVQGIVRDHFRQSDSRSDDGERPLYGDQGDADES